MKDFASNRVGNLVAVVKQYRSCLAVLCFLFGLSIVSFGQVATVVGTVSDPSGSVLPSVTVTATSVETGQTRTVTTSGTGEYVLPSLTIGHYNLKAEGSG